MYMLLFVSILYTHTHTHKTEQNITKFSIFRLTQGHERSCDSVLVCPIFVHMLSKDRKDLRENRKNSDIKTWMFKRTRSLLT